jgi:AraC-like DNA-binding protein
LAAYSDSALTYQKEGAVQCYPVNVFANIGGLRMDTAAALHGRHGWRLTMEQNDYFHARWTLPFQRDFWFRFYLRFDPGNITLEDNFEVRFMQLNGNQQDNAYKYSYLLRGAILKDKDESSKLVFYYRNLKGLQQGMPLCSLDIAPGTVYSLEAHCQLKDADTVCLALFMDGSKRAERSFTFPFPLDNLELNLFRAVKEDTLQSSFSLHVDDLLMSDIRPKPIPPAPSKGLVFIDVIPPGRDMENSFNLFRRSVVAFTPVVGSYQGEYFKEARWRLVRMDCPDYPLFQVTTLDSSEFFRIVLPFPLDSGIYNVQLAMKNNFGEWGDFSTPFCFHVDRPRKTSLLINRAFFSNSGDSNALEELLPEKWYDLNVFLNGSFNINNFGYLIAYWGHGDSEMVNPADKGGVFNSASNYVLNLSSSKDGSFHLFEKSTENSPISRVLPSGTAGMYLNAENQGVLLDSVRGYIKVKVRLLKNALPGVWKLTVFTRPLLLGKDSLGYGILLEDYSNIYQGSFRVKPVLISQNYLIISGIPVLILILLFPILKIIRKRKIARNIYMDVQADKTFQNIHTYIEAHLAEKMVVPDICKALGIGETTFYEVFRKKGVKFSNYYNELRIERVKKLLRETSRPIVDIAAEVGYTDGHYFSKLFRKSQGITPGEYRKQY